MADQEMREPREPTSMTDEEADALLDMDDVEETIEEDGDAAMDSGEEDGEDLDVEGPLEEIQLQNDSVAHFDAHKDSVYCIAQHPLRPEIVATGGGDNVGYVWDSTPEPTQGETGEGPVLPRSYESNPQPTERKTQPILARLEEQDETVNAIAFTLPTGDYIATGTLEGKLNIYVTPTSATPSAQLLASAKEVGEINWILPCPNKAYPNTVAFGANDGSVWVYTINPADTTSPLQIVQTFFLHQGSCTAGAWAPDGKLLATVSEDSSLYVWDVFGEASAAGITSTSGSQAVVSLTAEDERFHVDGGLYSIAISPGGGIVAVGGAEGNIRVVGLPRLSVPASNSSTAGAKGAGARSKAGGSKQAAASPATSATTGGQQAGQILASLRAQSDGVETLDFSQPPLTLLAAGSVDGSIVLFDAAHNFAVRRHIAGAHGEGDEDEMRENDDKAVIQVEFVKTALGTPNERGWVLTSCGNDGVVRRWDVRGSTKDSRGLIGEWRGHRGGGEGGGVLGFVQRGFGGTRIVTAGDDGVALVFNAA